MNESSVVKHWTGKAGWLLTAVTVCGCDVATGRTGTLSGAGIAVVPEHCLPAAAAATDSTSVWSPIELTGWDRQNVTPDTPCQIEPGAWFATYPVKWFVDAAAGAADSVVVLYHDGLLRLDSTGTPVQVVNLKAEETYLSHFSPSPQGGWVVLGDGSGYGDRLLRVSEAGEVLWRHEASKGRYFYAVAATADGGALAGGHEAAEPHEHAFWQYIDPQGVASAPVIWPKAGATSAILVRNDGSFCTGAGYGGYYLQDREVFVTCWQGTSPLWSQVVEEPALDDSVELSASPDGRLVVEVRSNRYGHYTMTILTLSPDGSDSQTIVPRMVTGYEGLQSWRWGSESLSGITALPCSTIGMVRSKVDTEKQGEGQYIVWERRSSAAVQTLLRLYASGGKYPAASTSYLFNHYSSARASLFRPDGSLWIVGDSWVYRVPPVAACPEVPGVLP